MPTSASNPREVQDKDKKAKANAQPSGPQNRDAAKDEGGYGGGEQGSEGPRDRRSEHPGEGH